MKDPEIVTPKSPRCKECWQRTTPLPNSAIEGQIALFACHNPECVLYCVLRTSWKPDLESQP
jgi:hypothetical protein